MSFSTDDSTSGPYACNGSQTAFTYDFKIFDDDDLEVYLKDAAGDLTLLTKTTHYTVAGVGDASGGSITTVATYASGNSILMRRKMSATQETTLGNQGRLFPEAIEAILDRIVMMVRYALDLSGQALRFPLEDDFTPGQTLPKAATRAGKVMVFDDNGDVTVSGDDWEDQASAASASAVIATTKASEASQDADDAAQALSDATDQKVLAQTAASEAAATAASLQYWDQFAQGVVIRRDLTAPPGSPSEGDAYIVASGATGDWASQDNKATAYVDSAWRFFTPEEGWVLYDQTADEPVRWSGSSWVSEASAQLASQGEAEAGTDNTKRMSPLRVAQAIAALQAAGANEAKAWVTLDGSGTVSILDSFNISGVTDSGTGLYDFTMTTALANANWAGVSASDGFITDIRNKAAGAWRSTTFSTGGTFTDSDNVMVAVFGDAA
jgi:hypothetical protein